MCTYIQMSTFALGSPALEIHVSGVAFLAMDGRANLRAPDTSALDQLTPRKQSEGPLNPPTEPSLLIAHREVGPASSVGCTV